MTRQKANDMKTKEPSNALQRMTERMSHTLGALSRDRLQEGEIALYGDYWRWIGLALDIVRGHEPEELPKWRLRGVPHRIASANERLARITACAGCARSAVPDLHEDDGTSLKYRMAAAGFADALYNYPVALLAHPEGLASQLAERCEEVIGLLCRPVGQKGTELNL